MINEESCNVRLPEDLERDIIPSNDLCSTERGDDGQVRPISLASYVRYRTRIYTIAAASLSRYMHTTRSAKLGMVKQRTQQLHERLLAWEKSVPQALKVETYLGGSLEDPVRRRFAMQAMALQMAYDNIQLALFRPFVSDGGPASSLAQSPQTELPVTPAGSSDQPKEHGGGVDDDDDEMYTIAFQQCFTSATRTSMIGSQGSLPILHAMHNSPINIHLGVHAFAAGVVLGLLALQNPASVVGQDCKRGIARLIQASKAAGLTAQVWTQAAGVLTELIRVVASEEVDALLRQHDERPSAARERTVCITPFGAPTDWYGHRTTVAVAAAAVGERGDSSTNPGDSSLGSTTQTPFSSDGPVDQSTSGTGGSDTFGSQCYVPSAASGGDVTAYGAGAMPDLSPFSEFTVENYTLYNYGQAWMMNNLNFAM